ncbi:hypothetical protein GQ53DRAFT_745315 [Thozetella sp. PMI_491]|nr:hypothetical protein GQ53DRAFT_745315 [Thozetella sp. PMI_491]
MADEITRLSAIKDNVERKQVRNTTQSPPTITTGAEETGEKTGATDVDMDLARKTWYYEFEALLHNTRVYSATDPRDKIYAILGIAKRSLPPGMPMPIMPDYSAASTARSLFTSVATMLLRERPRLVLLSFVQDKESTRAQDLPSWVPDWTCPLTGVPLTLMRKTACDFNCDPSRDEVGALFEVQEGCLALQGAQFDRIAEVAAPMWDIVKTQVIDSLLVLCENLSTEYLASHSGPGEVLWRTMVANTSDEQPAPASLATSFKAWASIRLARTVTPEILERDPTQELGFRNNTALDEEAIQSKLGLLKRLITQEENQSQLRAAGSGESATPTSSFPTIDNVLETCRLIHRTKLHAFIAQNSHFVTLDPHDPLPSIEEWVMRIEGTALAFQNAMAPALPFRRLYRTVGGYLGLGPASAQVGDQVWMIRGARVPFVLRDRSDPAGTFELLGATYVHGFMDGEMAAKVEGFRAVVIE